uniref:Carboxylesterase type B domain-containing protein n=1 Tax=Chelydra serpentina TaxID=8475 RepID=A0A8C3SJG9_CHESE
MLSGHDTGASSVGFHLLSPGSRSLFTRAVMQSGSPTSLVIWTSLKEAKERGRRLGQLLGCTDSDDTALVGCLQGKEPRELLKHEFSVLRRRELLGLPFVPTTDGDFLADSPSRLLQAKQIQPMPIATGFTANEGSYLLLFGAPTLHAENASNVGLEELLQVLRLIVPGAPKEAVRAVALWYSQEGEKQGKAPYQWAMEQIVGDYVIVCPVAEVASGLSTAEWTGVPHGSELPYQFGTLWTLTGANHTHTEAEDVLRNPPQSSDPLSQTRRAAVALWPGERNIEGDPAQSLPALSQPCHTSSTDVHAAYTIQAWLRQLIMSIQPAAAKGVAPAVEEDQVPQNQKQN